MLGYSNQTARNAEITLHFDNHEKRTFLKSPFFVVFLLHFYLKIQKGRFWAPMAGLIEPPNVLFCEMVSILSHWLINKTSCNKFDLQRLFKNTDRAKSIAREKKPITHPVFPYIYIIFDQCWIIRVLKHEYNIVSNAATNYQLPWTSMKKPF